jgi:hypothetical protein
MLKGVSHASLKRPLTVKRAETHPSGFQYWGRCGGLGRRCLLLIIILNFLVVLLLLVVFLHSRCGRHIVLMFYLHVALVGLR